MQYVSKMFQSHLPPFSSIFSFEIKKRREATEYITKLSVSLSLVLEASVRGVYMISTLLSSAEVETSRFEIKYKET